MPASSIKFTWGGHFKYGNGSKGENLTLYGKMLGPLLVELGMKKEMEEVERFFSFDFQHFGLIELLNLMSDLGFEIKSIPMNFESLDERSLPCLYIETVLTTQEERPYLVLNHKGNRFFAFDGCKDEMIYLDKNRNGMFYFFSRKENEASIGQSVEVSPNFSLWILSLIKRFAVLFKINMFLTLIISITSILLPFFVMTVYDKVIPVKDLKTMATLVVGISLSIGLEGYCRYKRGVYLSWLAVRLDHLVSINIFRKLISLSPGYLEQVPPLLQVARVNQFTSVRDFIMSSAGQILFDLIFVPFYLFITFLVGGIVVIVPVCVIAVYSIFCFYIYSRIKIDSGKNASNVGVGRNDLVEEFFMNLVTIKSSGQSDLWTQRFQEASGDYSFDKYKASFYMGNIENFSYFMSILSAAFTLLVGIYLVWANSMTVGSLIAIMMIIWRIIQPLQIVSTTFGKLNEMIATLKKIHGILKTSTESLYVLENREAEIFNGEIVFDNIGVKFPRHKDAVISGLNATIKSGEVVTVCGVLGAGKSTLLKTVNKTHQTQMGSLRIGGLEINQIHPLKLRRSIGFIPDKTTLLNITIEELLRLSLPNVSVASITDVLIDVGAWKYVKNLPGRTSYKIRFFGEELPEIVRFKLYLAQALLKRPKILLIDKIPNSLLADKEFNFFEFLKYKNKEMTVVVNTHRKDIIKKSDRVFVFVKRGRIVHGTLAEILPKLNGLFDVN